jgi:hypothetical protein
MDRPSAGHVQGAGDERRHGNGSDRRVTQSEFGAAWDRCGVREHLTLFDPAVPRPLAKHPGRTLSTSSRAPHAAGCFLIDLDGTTKHDDRHGDRQRPVRTVPAIFT